jgi:hypothetical protein
MTEETKTFEFQPTDADGRPLGSPVRIEYTGQKDLKAKLASEALRLKFTVARGTIKAPETAERFSDDKPIDAARIQKEALEFVRTTPAYHACPENFQALGRWLDDNELATTLENLRLAFATLAKAGLLLDAKGTPTSSADTTGITYIDGNGRTYHGKQAIDRMPASEYKRRLTAEFGFVDRVERVLAGR